MYIGIDLGGTNLKSSLFSSDFDWLDTVILASEANKGADQVMDNIYQSIALLLDHAGAAAKDIVSIGIGVPGLLDRKTGVALFSPNFKDWKDVPVARLVEERFNIPTVIDNDVRVNLYGEWHFGAGRNKDNVVLITLGTGVGSGVVVDGHVLYGKTDSAGEIGHMNMYRKGRPCPCGSSGCLSRYVSATGILLTAQEKRADYPKSILANEKNLTTQMISEAYDQKDAFAQAIYRETGEILGFGLSNVINIYNPEILIIGGGVSKAGERLLSHTREIVAQHSLQISHKACEIVTANLSDKAGMIGAAYDGAMRVCR